MNSYYTDQYPYEFGWSLYCQEQNENAEEIADYLVHHHHLDANTTYAILGNLTAESFLNPGQFGYHQGVSLTNSYGLAQWDPGTKFENYLIGQGIMPSQPNLENYQYQLDYLVTNAGQWNTVFVDMNTGYSSYYNCTVPIYPTMADFFADTQASLDDKTLAWMVYWERPQPGSNQTRIDYANHWAGSISVFALIWLLAKVATRWRL